MDMNSKLHKTTGAQGTLQYPLQAEMCSVSGRWAKGILLLCTCDVSVAEAAAMITRCRL